jgi:hypothetical protein
MLRASSLAPLLLLGLFMRSSGPSLPTPGASSPAPGGPAGLEVARVLTGGQPLQQWFTDRFRLALEVLTPNVVNDPRRRGTPGDIALSVVAQWAHETGRGKAEFNFNLGGWRARKKDPYFVARDVQTGQELFRWTAYNDLPNAVHDQLRRLHDTFPSAWALLISEPHTSRWIEELGRRGYYTADPANYARAWAANRAELGEIGTV